MECEFCNKSFKTKSNLNNHQKNARYCLEIRNKQVNFNCEYCEKNFSSKYGLSIHQNECLKFYKKIKEKIEREFISSKDEIITKLEEQVRELQNKLENVAIKATSRPINVHNNQRINTIINNMLPITDEHLEEQAQYLTMEHVKNGASGYAKYALEYPLKNRIACVDFARRKIKYKNKDGDIIVDPDMSRLTQKLFLAIESRNSMLIDTYIKELRDKLNVMNREAPMDMNENEHAEFSERMDGVVDFMIQESSKMRDVKQISKGVKSDIYNEFIKEVCSGAM